jgi:hypothetical protein
VGKRPLSLSVFNGYSIFMEANMSESLQIAYFKVWPNNPAGSWPRRTQISCTYFGLIESRFAAPSIPLVTCFAANFGCLKIGTGTLHCHRKHITFTAAADSV